MELAVSVPNLYMYDMFVRLQTDSKQAVIEEALTILQWVVDEIRKGRIICSCDKNGNNVRRITTPSLAKLYCEVGTQI